MTTETVTSLLTSNETHEYATFYLGDMLLGIDILRMREINRQLEVTSVPHAPDYVSGVVNLRGDVVTILDLRQILGLEPREITPQSRNIIVNTSSEQIGLLVDRIADVISAQSDEIDPPPANLHGVDGKYFAGIYKKEAELLVILDIERVVAAENIHS
jgi:purine-binding chemotaxis protein CheW